MVSGGFGGTGEFPPTREPWSSGGGSKLWDELPLGAECAASRRNVRLFRGREMVGLDVSRTEVGLNYVHVLVVNGRGSRDKASGITRCCVG